MILLMPSGKILSQPRSVKESTSTKKLTLNGSLIWLLRSIQSSLLSQLSKLIQKFNLNLKKLKKMNRL
jgi:hypothetical protein